VSARILVVGGGISGLASAWRLAQARPQDDITVLEAASDWGGVIRTVREGPLVCDVGPDCLLRRPAAERLIADLGLASEVITVREEARRSLIARGRRLLPVPEGFYLVAPGRWRPFLRSGLISIPGMLRMAMDLRIRPGRVIEGDESLASFVRRHFGQEVLERIAQPLVAGITIADPEQLSVEAALPQLIEMERTHGSLLKAMRARARGADAAAGPRYGLFIALRAGMGALIERLAARLRERGCTLEAASRATELARHGDAWQVQVGDRRIAAERVVLALPAPAASPLLRTVAPAAAAALASVPHSSVDTVMLAYDAEAVPALPEAAGLVVPAVEGRALIAATFVDRKFADRAPPGTVLLRAFLARGRGPSDRGGDDARLVQLAHSDLAELLGLRSPPRWSVVTRWQEAMPQYTLGHRARVARAMAALADHPTLGLVSNALSGVGIGELCEQAEALAERWRAGAS
jgi:oxygen-dependent protoporphyrinogen oxidase